MGYLFAALLFLGALPAGAVEVSTAAPDAEQLSHDMISDVDGWLGRLNDKLQSDRPVTEEDFDSLFGDSFLSGSEDPAADIERAEDRLNEKLGGNRQVSETYDRWLEKKLPAAGLEPQVVDGPRHIAVNFKTPGNPRGPVKATVRRGRITISYALAAPGGKAVPARRHAVMAVPAEADPGKYQIRRRKGGVSVIFDRLANGKKKTEATK
jgi:hypothetical protein